MHHAGHVVVKTVRLPLDAQANLHAPAACLERRWKDSKLDVGANRVVPRRRPHIDLVHGRSRKDPIRYDLAFVTVVFRTHEAFEPGDDVARECESAFFRHFANHVETSCNVFAPTPGVAASPVM